MKLFLITGALLLLNCSSPKSMAEGDGNPIRVKVGETVAVDLPSNITTGYTWQLDEQTDTSRARVATHVYERGKGQLAGQGGTEHWTFEAIRAGEATIFLRYVRPWEKEIPADTQRKTIQVTITE